MFEKWLRAIRYIIEKKAISLALAKELEAKIIKESTNRILSDKPVLTLDFTKGEGKD